MTTSAKSKFKRSRGQAARVENQLDLNVAFQRAYQMFVKMFNRDPDWLKTNTKLRIQKESVICEIQEG